MKRENLLTTIALALAFIPFYAGAEAATSTPPAPATEAQVFTACSQAAIEVRDNSIGAARTTYNIAMANALSARKEAEKSAVAFENVDEKKDAIRVAVDEYKKAVTAAQDGLTKARKEAWATFEAETNNCRDTSKELRKEAITEKKGDAKAMQALEKSEIEEVKAEVKSFRESILDQLESIKNFFKL